MRVWAKSFKNTRLIKYTENKLTIIPIPNVSQNHLIILIPNINRINETISPVILESQIAEKDCWKPIFCASSNFFPFRSSSFILSNIKTFASMAIPIESTSQPREASVCTTQNCFKTASVKII